MRLVRISRVGRIVRYVRALRILLLSILSTVRTVLFAFALLWLIIYFYAIILTQGVLNYKKDHGEDSIEGPYADYFSGLFESMLTLFFCISGGIPWRWALEPLRQIHILYACVL